MFVTLVCDMPWRGLFLMYLFLLPFVRSFYCYPCEKRICACAVRILCVCCVHVLQNKQSTHTHTDTHNTPTRAHTDTAKDRLKIHLNKNTTTQPHNLVALPLPSSLPGVPFLPSLHAHYHSTIRYHTAHYHSTIRYHTAHHHPLPFPAPFS